MPTNVMHKIDAWWAAFTAWLLFFDADRQAEWFGIWDDSPPPPLVDFAEE